MSSIIRNGVVFNGATTEDVTVVAFAEKAICDIDGNNISDTYLKKEGFKRGGLFGTNLYNSIYRGKDITSYFLDGSLYTRITSGNFDDLYVGDYFKAIINGQEITCHIAGFDIYMNHGYPEYIHNHHVVIVPDEALTSAKMNETNITTDGYAGSMMRRSTISVINSHLETTFGEHLLTMNAYFSNSVDTTIHSPGFSDQTGCCNSAEWVDSKADLLSEVEVYGTRAFGSSVYDTGMGTTQLPLFRINPKMINPGRFDWWLRAVASSTEFATVSSNGDVSFNHASNTRGVRPRWIIG